MTRFSSLACQSTVEFACNNGTCIDSVFRCDGEPHCLNSEDEKGCSVKSKYIFCSLFLGFGPSAFLWYQLIFVELRLVFRFFNFDFRHTVAENVDSVNLFLLTYLAS